MAADRIKSLNFCRAIEESSNNGLLALDRESLLAATRLWRFSKMTSSRRYLGIPLDVHALN
jgi:hypothetical protein